MTPHLDKVFELSQEFLNKFWSFYTSFGNMATKSTIL